MPRPGKVDTWQSQRALEWVPDSRLHLRTRKTYDILTRLEDNSLPKVQNIKYIKIFEENSTAFRLKHRYLSAQEKTVYNTTFPFMGNHQHVYPNNTT